MFKQSIKIFLLGILAVLVVSSCDKNNADRKIKLRSTDKPESGLLRDMSTTLLKIEPEKRRSIAVMYFENLTGDNNLDWMQRGIAEMLVTSLSQSRYLDVIGLERLYSVLRKLGKVNLQSVDLGIAAALANEVNVESVVMGKLHKEGSELIVEADLYETKSGRLLSTEKVSGQLENAFTMMDDLSRKVKTGLRVKAAEKAEIQTPLENVTTRSLKAYEFYNLGLSYSERVEENKAIQFFEKAIEEDPEFAIAYAALSDEYLRAGDDLKSIEAMDNAVRFIDRATAVDREYIRGAKALNDLDLDLAKQRFERVIAADSSRIDAYVRLASVQIALQQFRDAEKLLSIAAAQNEFSPIVQVLKGLPFLYTGRYAEARSQFEIANQLNPNSAISKVLLGLIYWTTGRMREAEAELIAALEIQPNNISALTNLGTLYSRWEGNNQAAIELFKRALEVSPHSSIILSSLGSIYERTGNYELALEKYNQALKLHSQVRPNVLMSAANVHLRLGHDKKAKKIFDDVLKMFSESDAAPVMCGISNLYFSEEMLEEAFRWIEKSLELRPGLLCGLDQKARILSLRGKYKESAEVLRRILKINPTSGQHKRMLAANYLSQDRVVEALAVVDSCIALVPNDVSAYVLKHHILTEFRDHEQALKAIKIANEQVPSFDRGYLLQGESYLKLNQRKDARLAFATMLEMASDSITAENRIASILLENNLKEEALAYLHHIVELRPEAAWTHCSLADGLKHNWQLDDAIREYRKALAINEDDLDCIRDLGHTYTLAEQFDDARKMYREYAKRNLSITRQCYAEKWIAMSHAYAGQYGKALKHLQKSYKYAQQDEYFKMAQDVLVAQGNLLNEMGKHRKAIEVFQKIINDNSDSDLARSYLGLAYLESRDPAMTRSMIDTLVARIENGAPSAHLRYSFELQAELELFQGKPESACANAKRALNVRNDRKVYYDYLVGKCLLADAKPDSAISYLDKVIKSVANNFFFVYIRPRARLLKAEALAQLGKTDQSILECEKLLKQMRHADKNLPLLKSAVQLSKYLKSEN